MVVRVRLKTLSRVAQDRFEQLEKVPNRGLHAQSIEVEPGATTDQTPARGDLVANEIVDSPAAATLTAVLVMNSGAGPLLCPFFEKCDGFLLINAADGSKSFYQQECSGVKSTRSMCELILELKPQQLICGFISEPEWEKLRSAGIDVRLGSCSCSVEELVSSFSTLPKA